MADDSADDPKAQARLAEREYLQQRLAELTPEYQKATEEAGLTPQMVTPQEIERLKGELVGSDGPVRECASRSEVARGIRGMGQRMRSTRSVD